MGNLILVGQANHRNFGDQLIFKIFIDRILNGQTKPALIYKPTADFLKDLDHTGSTNEISSGDEVIFVSGGYFGPSEFNDVFWSRRFSHSFIGQAVHEVLASGCRFKVVGVEVGPYLSRSLFDTIRAIDRSAEHFIVRNQASLDQARRIGCKRVTSIPDVIDVYGDTIGPADQKQRQPTLLVHATGRLVSRSPLARWNARQLLAYAARHDLSVNFISDSDRTDGHVSENRDHLSALSKTFGVTSEFTTYAGMDTLIDQISGATHLVTSKLHVGVVGLNLGCRVNYLSTHPKVHRFASEHRGKVKAAWPLFPPARKIENSWSELRLPPNKNPHKQQYSALVNSW